jgi:hypothetical protein
MYLVWEFSLLWEFSRANSQAVGWKTYDWMPKVQQELLSLPKTPAIWTTRMHHP